MELGLYTFADVHQGPGNDEAILTHKRIQNLMEEIKLAEEVGLDIFGVGEHHRRDYAVSSTATILAAAAMITKKIKLTSAVTVLSSDDPVRIFQDFATIDQLSGGRAEIMVGRGSFIESFSLFGYNLDDYDKLFAEKLELLLKLNQSEFITWTGKLTHSIDNKGVYPRPFQSAIPICRPPEVPLPLRCGPVHLACHWHLQSLAVFPNNLFALLNCTKVLM